VTDLRLPTRGAGALLVACLALGATACSSTDETPTASSPTTTAAPSATTSATPSATPTTEAAPAAATGDLTMAPWAFVAPQGLPELATVQAGALSVQLFDGGRGTASEDLFYSNGTQAMTLGEPLVYLAWTATNTSDQPVVLGSSALMVDVSHLGSQTVPDYPSSGYHAVGLESGSMSSTEYHEDNRYVLAPGESFTSATNFPLDDGGTWDLTLRWTPVDDAGDLVHDQAVRVETTVQIS
jgi:hypothetical protein